ncbi:MAG: RagB/SusD family nutrient uptake outer membrane protein [Bacteroidetes bacterium 13_1_20CM_4_60_6]|nr:MAG: RagB/SusD family nutrient uptake outer membrane protein [Bacteroidetes bacterium 13_1_20CM_4_60_6]
MRIESTCLKSLLAVLAVVSVTACDLLSPTSLDQDPNDILLEDEVWKDPNLIRAVLANYYDRLPETYGLGNNQEGFAQWDDAIWSGSGNGPNTLANYDYGYQSLWDYQLIRDINLFLEKVDQSARLLPGDKQLFRAEARFLRAYVYFELVKRMGGVPLVTRTYTYSLGDDPTELQFPRNTEAEVYDFIGSELDAIKDEFARTSTSKTRANRWTALALKSRAMLYAGSLAKYNNLMAQSIATPGGEVGIPAARANDYYAKSLAAAQEIIQSGSFQLYSVKADRGENFYDAITSKVNNPEVIWARDFSVPGGKLHNFTYNNIPRSLREDNESGSEITPILNLVEAYEYLDGSNGDLKTLQPNGDFVYYDRPEDIFANKDARLAGTVIYPGATFRGRAVNIQAGVMVWNPSTQAYDEVTGALGSNYTDGKLQVGLDGPHVSEPFVSNTGFYLRKYLDPTTGSGQRGRGSDVWWIRFRYAEILLNAAEAAYELGDQGLALGYVQQVRARAGFAPASLAALTIDRLRNERRVELAFENHRLWDLKRWRIAHEVWNGDRMSPTAQLYALWPYRVVRPGDVRDGKYVFVKMPAPRVSAPRFFRLGNYYSEISDAIISANPKIVKNPFH